MGLGYAPLERLGSIFENLIGGTRAGGIFSVDMLQTNQLSFVFYELNGNKAYERFSEKYMGFCKWKPAY